jgi:hypothetical protein
MTTIEPLDLTLRTSGLRPSPYVEVRDTRTPKGLGVFALCDLRPETVVDVSPVLLLQVTCDSLPPALQVNVFDWHDLGGHSGAQALALGYGSLYNGANPANMRYEAIWDNPRPMLRFIAVKMIKCGQELTVNYSGPRGAAESANNWWFERKRIMML